VMHLKIVIVHIVKIHNTKFMILKLYHSYDIYMKTFILGSSISLLPLHFNVAYNIDYCMTLLLTREPKRVLSQNKSCIDDVNI
jgi:hypothetical protein